MNGAKIITLTQDPSSPSARRARRGSRRISAFFFFFLALLLGAPFPLYALTPILLPDTFLFNDSRDKLFLKMPDGQVKETHLIPEIQLGLETYLMQHGNPIAAIVIADIHGNVLAMVQGQNPKLWQQSVHTALYPGFPAASIFKNVSTAAFIEAGGLTPQSQVRLSGNCGHVNPGGVWLKEEDRAREMTLDRAYALSCNSFFAKTSIQSVGVSIINEYAKKLGWFHTIPSDFKLDPSPIFPPKEASSGAHTVGRYAAGLGFVGMSVAHSAWMTLVIASGGKERKLALFVESLKDPWENTILDESTVRSIRSMMHTTVTHGTGRIVFSQKPFRWLQAEVGGKTGTLSSDDPKGLATWFSGIMPIEQPQIVVSAVVINGNHWQIKGLHLAAQGFNLWAQHQRNKNVIANKSKPAAL